MTKKQKYLLTIISGFIVLFIITSIISYQKITYYHRADRDFYVSITERFIQPFYNNTSIFIWGIGIFTLIFFTYCYFRNYNDPVYKKYMIDYKLLLKTSFVFILIFFFIGISGEIFPKFSVRPPEIELISQTEYEDNTNINENDFDLFNKENWIEI